MRLFRAQQTQRENKTENKRAGGDTPEASWIPASFAPEGADEGKSEVSKSSAAKTASHSFDVGVPLWVILCRARGRWSCEYGSRQADSVESPPGPAPTMHTSKVVAGADDDASIVAMGGRPSRSQKSWTMLRPEWLRGLGQRCVGRAAKR